MYYVIYGDKQVKSFDSLLEAEKYHKSVHPSHRPVIVQALDQETIDYTSISLDPQELRLAAKKPQNEVTHTGDNAMPQSEIDIVKHILMTGYQFNEYCEDMEIDDPTGGAVAIDKGEEGVFYVGRFRVQVTRTIA